MRFARGRTISSVLAAATYISCMELGISSTLNDIAIISDVKYKYLARTFRQLVFELDLKIPAADLMKCITKVANKANLSEKTKRTVESLYLMGSSR